MILRYGVKVRMFAVSMRNLRLFLVIVLLSACAPLPAQRPEPVATAMITVKATSMVASQNLSTVTADYRTPEERANTGTHQYTAHCEAFNDCACEYGYTQNYITFAQDQATILGKQGTTSYQKVEPNVYVYTSTSSTIGARLKFRLDGLDFEVTSDGKACVVQIYTLSDQK